MGQIVQSHVLSFFHLSSPDILLGFDAPVKIRNVVGLTERYPELAKKGILLRKFGQEIIKTLGGKKVHPWHSIPGGVNRSLTPQERDNIAAQIPEMKSIALEAIKLIKGYLEEGKEEAKEFATVETAYMGLVRDGNLELYDGNIRIKAPRGRILDEFDPKDYLKYIGEHVEPWSYLKFPFYKSLGFPHGSYRVGPLARLNAADNIDTPQASKEYALYKQITDDGIVPYTLYYHYARLIEALYGIERIEQLLSDPEITSSDLRVTSKEINPEGVGVIEAPRGTLIHHYWVNESGVITKVNLIVATGHNNYAMNKGVEAVAKKFIKGRDIPEGVFNRLEHVIRAYDPCLSCSTHAVGKMPLKLELISSAGEVIKEVVRANCR